jgi:hypothetical protein
MLVYALTSSQSPRETLDLFVSREAAEAAPDGGVPASRRVSHPRADRTARR